LTTQNTKVQFYALTNSNTFPAGEWKPKNIKNPAYKGKWVHPEIDNPEYASDDSIYSYDDFGRVGLDLWQVKTSCILQILIDLR